MVSRNPSANRCRCAAPLHVSLALVLATALAASAAPRTWSGGGADDFWNTAANWGGVAPAASDSLIFAGTTRLTPNNNITAATNFVGITFSAGAGAFTLSGSSISLGGDIINNSASLQIISLSMSIASGRTIAASSGDIMIGGVISGSAGLTKTGMNLLTLAGANTYTGSTTVSAGTLKAGSNQSFGSNSAVTLANSTGTFLDLDGFNNTIGSLAGGGGSGGNVILGAAFLTTGGNNTSTTFSGMVSGTGALIKTGTGTFTLAGTNTYTGATTVSNGTLKAGIVTAAFGSNSGVSLANTAGTSLDITGYNNTIGSLSGGGVTGGSVILGAATLTTGGDNTSTTYAGTINGAGGGLAKTGAGTLMLSGTNTYTGLTTINNGVLKIGAAGDGTNSPLGTTASGTVVNNGGTLDLAGWNLGTAEPLTLNGAGYSSLGALRNTAGGAAIYSGLVTLGSASTINMNNGALTLSNTGTITGSGFNLTLECATGSNGTINSSIGTGSGGVIKTGTGTFILSGSSTYSGPTTVNAGTLKAGIATAAFGSGSAVTLANNSSTSLDITGYNNTIGSLSGGGATGGDVILGAATLTTGGNGTSTTYAGVISGTGGGLTKTGSGALTLSGSNTYSGTTTLSGGTLNLNNLQALGNGPFTINGGTIDNTSGSSGTLTSTGTQTWNGDFTYGGSFGLNTGTAPVIMTSSRFITVSANMLTVGGAISGTFALTKEGPGMLVLSGSNTYTGATVVNGGLLLVNGSTAGNATVNTSATLGGTGTISGTVTINAGGTIAPGTGGTAIGVLTTGAMTFSTTSTSTYSVDLDGTAPTCDRINSTGTVALGSAISALNVASIANSVAGDVYIIVSAASVTGTFSGKAEASTFVASGRTLRINYTATQVTLTDVTAVEILGSWVGGTTHTVEAGSNRLLLVFVGGEHNGVWGVTGITYGGQAMTQICGNVAGATFRDRMEAWYLNEAGIAAAGSSTITPSYSVTPSEGSHVESVFLQGVNQFSPIGATGTNTNDAASTLATAALATINGDMAFVAGVSSVTGTSTLNNGFTKDYDGAEVNIEDVCGHKACSGASETPSYTAPGSGRIVVLGFVVQANIAGTTWDGGGADDNWNTALNWDLDIAPSAGNALQFAGSTRLTPNNNFTAGTSFGGLIFNAGAGAFTLGGTSITLAGSVTNSSSNLQTVNMNMTMAATRDFAAITGNIAVGGVLSGAGGLTKSGTGTLTLSGSNTFSGGTTLSAGTLNINSSTALGTGPFTINGGTIDNTSAGDLTLSTTGTQLAGDFNYAGSIHNLNLGLGPITLTSNRTVTVNGNTLFVGGAISGAFALTKAGSGTLVLTGSNSYSGTTAINTGTLQIGDGAQDGSIASSSGITDNASLILNVAGSRTYGNVISGTGTLTKSGSGTLILTGSNSYTGATAINTGTLQIGDGSTDGSIASSSGITDNASLIFNVAGSRTYGNVISGTGTLTKSGSGMLILTGTNSYTGTTAINTGTLQIGDGATDGSIASSSGITDNAELAFNIIGSRTYNNSVSGSGTLTKSGSGTLTLSGSNSYSGPTTVNAGTLSVTGSIAAGSSVTVNSGATLGGTGSILGAVTLNAGATLAPSTGGTTIGTLRTGSLTLSPTSTLSVDLSATGPTQDSIYSTGTVTCAGTLTIASLGGTPTNGNVYEIIQATSVTGTFAGLADNAIFTAQSRYFQIDYTGTQVTLTDVAVPTTLVWDGGGVDDNWNTALNWDSDIVPSATNALQFAGSTRLTPNNNYTAATSFGSLTFNAGAGAFTLSGTSITLAGSVTNSSSNLQTINFDMAMAATRDFAATNGNIAVNGVLSGAGGLTKSGSGTLTLSGTNTYTGATSVTLGTLKAGIITSAFGNSSALTLTNSASTSLDITGYSNTIGSLSGGGTTGGNLILSNTATLTTGGNNTSTTYAGVISGTGGALVKTGSGAFTLSGTNTYTGGTTLSAGMLNINHTSAIGTGTFTINGGTIDNTSAGDITLSNNNAQSWNGDFTYTGGTRSLNMGTGTVTLSGDRTVTVSGSTLTIDGSISGAYNLTKEGAGALTLSGVADNDNITFTIVANAGTVNLAKASSGTVRCVTDVTVVGATVKLDGSGGNQIRSQGVVTINSGTFDMNGKNESFDILTGSGGYVDNTGGGTSTLTVGQMSGSGTYSGIIQNTVNTLELTKTGTGTQTLSGTNTYTGATTINLGTLKAGIITSAFGSNSALTLTNSASTSLDLNNFSNTIGSLSGGGASGGNVILGAATLTTGGDNSNTTYAGVISGTGGLTKTGSGTFTLSGTNTYTGGTSVNNGWLLIEGSIASASAVTVDGGVLGGSGSVGGAVTVLFGTVEPGVVNAQLSTGDITFNSGAAYMCLLTGPTHSGTDRLSVTGSVTLDGTLLINLSYAPSIGDKDTIILNDGADAVNGTFSGLSEGAIIQVNFGTDYLFKISYIGGTGNDVVLTCVAGKIWTNNSATNLWSTPGNWLPSGTPTGSDSVIFNAGSAACSLNVSAAAVKALTFTSGYTGVFKFGPDTLSVTGNVDLSSGGAISAGKGTLKFTGASSQTLVPHATSTIPCIVQNGSGGTTIQGNPLRALKMKVINGTVAMAGGLTIDTIEVNSPGVLNLGSGGYNDTVKYFSGSGGLDIGTCALYATGGMIDFSTLAALTPGTGTLAFVANAKQTLAPFSGLMPNVVHSGTDTLQLQGFQLRAASFLQSAGIFDLNGFWIDTLVNDFTITNGHKSSILGLGGNITKVGGNASLSGQTGNLLNLDPGSAWQLKVYGTLNANFAAIKNCNASVVSGNATNSYDLGNNTNWTSITGNPRVEPGPANLTIGGPVLTDKDSIPMMHLRMLTSQAEGAYIDTVRAKMVRGKIGAINYMRLFADLDRNGAFNPPTDRFIKDTTLSAGDSSICFAKYPGMHLDSLMAAQDTLEYWLAMDLNGTPVAPSDTFVFRVTPSAVAFAGKQSSIAVKGAGTQFIGDTAWGTTGAATIAAADSNLVIGKPTVTDQDTNLCMHFSVTANATEAVFLDTVRVKMVQGVRAAIDKMRLFRDGDNNGIFVPANDQFLYDATAATDSVATFFKTGHIDSIGLSSSKKYWLVMDLNATAIGSTDTFKFHLVPSLSKIGGKVSGVSFAASGAVVYGDTVPGDIVPAITDVSSSATNGTYDAGAVVTVQVNFNKPVFVTAGTPELTLETGVTDRVVPLSGGSGTSTLSFDYTVQAGDTSPDLDYVSTSALAAGAANIRDAVGRNANLTLPTPGATGSLSNIKNILIDAKAPKVLYVSSGTIDGTYDAGYVVQVGVKFNKVVTVTGAPEITLETGVTDRVAQYQTGGGSDSLSFTYTVQAGDTSNDLDYTSTNALAIGGGSIMGAGSNPADLTLPTPGTTNALSFYKGIVIDAKAPKVLHVSSGTVDGTYDAGYVVQVGLKFNKVVTVTGAPEITLETGVTDRVAQYQTGGGSDSLSFTYTVQAGDTSNDLDYTSTNALAIGGGSIMGAGSNPADLTLPTPGTTNALSFYKGIVIDAKAPKVLYVSSGMVDGTYQPGQTVQIGVKLSKMVTVSGTPELTLETGVTDRIVQYQTGTGTDSLSFTYTVQAGDTSNDLDYLSTTALTNGGGSVYGAGSNPADLTLPPPGTTGSLGFNKGIVIDGRAPKVLYVSSGTVDGTYQPGQTVQIGVKLSKTVTVSGTPELTLETGVTDRIVQYQTGTGTDSLSFTYTVQAGDTSNDLDYLSTTALTNGGGSVYGAGSNPANLTLPTPGTTGSLGFSKGIVIDGRAPKVLYISSGTPNGVYGTSQNIQVGVKFSKTVTVTGVPEITLETGTTDRSAQYQSGSGSDSLSFNYFVQTGDNAGDLDYLSTTALALAGGTIQGAGSNPAELTLPLPGTTGSLGFGKSIIVDAAAPWVAGSALSAPNGGEVWQAGTSHNITWNLGDISDLLLKQNPITLHYSTDNGSTFLNLIASNLANTGSYSWTVSSENSSQVRVRISVTDSVGNTSYDTSGGSFYIDNAAPTVASNTLTAPNGGEVLAASSNVNISWNSGGISDIKLKFNPISLYYSTDGGVNFPNLIASNLAPGGPYNWTVPSVNSNTVRVRIHVTDSVGNVSYDTSDANFTIDNAAPVVAPTCLTSPNGGEVWVAGSNHNITWNTGDISDVQLKGNPISLYYSTDGGSTFPNTIANDTANSGSYNWTLPSLNANNIRVRITVKDSAGNAGHDTSNGNFTVDNSAPAVASNCITSPNGGEVWAAGSSHTITWNTGSISDALLKNNPVSLNYSTDGGASFSPVIATGIANSGSYTWTVANENVSTMRIRISVTDSLGNISYDTSNGNFTVDNGAPQATSSTLVSPNGGEVWQSGTSHSVTWNTSIPDAKLAANPISLYYSIDGGVTFPNLIASNLSNNGTYAWAGVTGNNSTMRVRISVRDSLGNIAYDTSDANFTIDSTKPSGGSVTILDSSGYTNQLYVNLSLTITGADSMQFRHDGNSWSAWEPSGSTKTAFDISAGGEGAKNVDVQFKDRAGNLSATYSDVTQLDTTKPGVGTIAIQDNNGFTKDVDPALTFLGITGASLVRYGVNDSNTMGAWRNFIAPDSVNLGSEGGKRVWAQFRDQAGNLSVKISDTTTYDVTSPSAGSMTITDNGGYTNDADPRISYSTVIGADSVRYGVNDTAAPGSWKPYSAADSVNLGAEGGKRVWAQFRDFAGNKSAFISDTTWFDSTKPVLTMGSTAPAITNSSPIPVTATWTEPVTDFISGDLVLTNATAANFTGSGSSYSFDLVPAGQGTVAVDVAAGAARDTATNLSPAAVQFSRIYDTQGPVTGTMSIKSNAGFTNDADPRITFTGVTGADSVRYGINDSATGMGAWKFYASPDSVNLATQGGKRVWAQFKDMIGNLSVKISDTVTLDQTAPGSLSFTISDNFGNTNDPQPDITIGASGADSMSFKLNTGSWSAWEPYSTLKTNFDISAGGQGMKDIYGRVKDLAGNVDSTTLVEATNYDITPPSFDSMRVSDKSGFTNDADPAIVFWNAAGVDSVCFSINDSAAMGAWQSFHAIDSINIGAPGGKRIWAQLKDLAGNKTVKVSDTTTFDMTGPVAGSMAIKDNSGFTGDNDPQIYFTGVTGADSVRYGVNDSSTFGPWRVYASPDSIVLGASQGGKRVWAQFRDLAGNLSALLSDSTNYDVTAPTSPMVNILADKTNDSTPALGLSAVAADSMRLAAAADTATALWKGYSISDSISIAAGGDGQKKVFAQFRDHAGNATAWIFDTVLYDGSQPSTLSFTILDKNGYSNDPQPDMMMAATGADSMSFNLNGGTWSAWEVYATGKSNFDIASGGDGVKKIYLRFKDFAGNTTDGTLYDSTKFDVTAPQSVTGIALAPLPDGRAALAWVSPVLYSADADTVMIRYSSTNYPSDTGSQLLWKRVGVAVTFDTINGLAEKTTYYVGLFVKDKAGNWSVSDTGSRRTVYMPDKTPPANTITLTATAIDTNHVLLAWNPSAITAVDVDSVGIWYKTTGYPLSWDEPLAQPAGRYPMSITNVTLAMPALSTLYFGLAVRDSSGNWSSIPANACDTATAIAKPGPLNYRYLPIIARTGSPIAPDTCANPGGIADSFTIAPALPAGIAIDRNTGILSGTPLSVSPQVHYTIRATNRSGADSTILAITVNPPAPGPLHFAWTALACTVGVAAPPDTLTNSGGPVDSFTIAPPLPQGLVIDGKTGTVTGTPLISQGMVPHVVTGVNAGGSTVCTLRVSVIYPKPKAAFAAQPATGAAPLVVMFADSSKGFIDSRQWTFGDGYSDSIAGTMGLSHTYINDGVYTVRLVVKGPGGQDTLAVPACVTVSDTTPPLPVSNLATVALNCSTAVIAWSPSSSPDADSIARCVSVTALPQNPAAGEFRRVLGTAAVPVMRDTVRGLPPLGTKLYAAVYTKDRSGNWSAAVRDSMVMPDCVPPVNSMQVTLASVGDTAVSVSIKTGATQADARELAWSFSSPAPMTQFDSSRFAVAPYRDTAFTILQIKIAGTKFLSTIVRDSAGNLSSVKIDSVTVFNRPPLFVTRPKDTVVSEDTLLLLTFAANDWNNDTVCFSILEGPKGATVDSLNGVFSWTPGDSDVGINRIVVSCTDRVLGNFAPTLDTVVISVVNVNEPPQVTIVGDTAAAEDRLYRATVKTGDPDLKDSVKIITAELPSWLTLSGDTIRGIPANEHIGVHTLRMIVADNAGLKATATMSLHVVNTNDTPVVQRVVTPPAGYADSALDMVVFAYDLDAGDSVSFEWRTKPSWLSLAGAATAPEKAEWQFTLAGTPGKADTGQVPYSFVVIDRDGATALVSGNLTIIARPNTVIGKKQVAYGSARYVLRPANPLDTGVTFVTKLTSLVDSSVIDRTVGQTVAIEYYPLVDGTYVFTAYAVDSRGLRETGLIVDTLVIRDATTHTWLGDSAAWQMISVPLASIEADPVRGSGYLVTWDESRPERDIYGYYIPSKEIRSLIGGRSYWRKSPDTVDISIDRESLVDSSMDIRLSKAQYGWNMIANPYVYPVAWNGALQAWKWNGSDFEPAGSVLEPWQGYWVMAESSTVVTLEPVPVWSDSLLPRAKSAFCVSRNEWRLKVALAGRMAVDGENAIGISSAASDGYDRADLYEPPRMQGQGYLFFPHPEWKKVTGEFASDIRKHWEPVNMFEVGIAPWVGNDSATVRIGGYENLAGMYVFVRTAAGLMEYDPVKGISLPASKETRYITIVVTADRGLAQKLPVTFLCGDPYPNPSRSAARIRYTLPYEWDRNGRLSKSDYAVKIVIYDLAGRRIRDLVNHKRSAGSYDAVWDCKMNTGRIVGAGVFMYTLQAGRYKAVKQITVLR